MSEDTNRPASGSPPTRAKGWQPPSAEELQQLLPQYEITALLGRGGMGAVYKGTQKNLERPVAIKILPPGMDEDDNGANFTERFKNEARAMAKLNHPGIVEVYDFGETADGVLYIVMEFIEGTDVQKMVSQQGRLHTAHAMAITAHVCDALGYAHERGIIHRDIKPANIMVGYDGGVKVADFGLAKMDRAGESGLTRSGMAMGTLHYMAPEALMLGTSVDHRADIYAVGVMFYFMLTGKLPQGMFELPSLQVPGLDPRYDGIITKALRDDREIRYQSTAELRLDLDGILTQPLMKVRTKTQPAPAAEAKPQVPAGHQGYYRPPAAQVEIRVEKRGSQLLWLAVVLMSGVTLWLWWDKKNSNSAEPMAVASELAVPAPKEQTPSVSTTPKASPPSISQQTAPSPQGEWESLLPDKLRAMNGLVPEPSDSANPGARFRATSRVLVTSSSAYKNCVIRARFSGSWTTVPSLIVRHQEAEGNRHISTGCFGYEAQMRNHSSSGGYQPFVRQDMPAPILRDQSFDLELHAVGDHYAFIKDGKVLAEGTMADYPEGRVGFSVDEGTVIEKFEVMALEPSSQTPPAAETSAIASSLGHGLTPGVWHDLIKENLISTVGLTPETANDGSGRALYRAAKLFLSQSTLAFRDCVVRVKFDTCQWKIAPWLRLRMNEQKDSVSCTWVDNDAVLRHHHPPISAWNTFGKKDMGATLSGSQPFVLELKAVGDQYTFSKDGKILIEGRYSGCDQGTVGLRLDPGTIIESFEVMPLDGLSGQKIAAALLAGKTAGQAVSPSPQDTGRMKLLVDASFEQPVPGFPNSSSKDMTAEWKDGSYRLTALSKSVWRPDMPTLQELKLDNFVCEVEFRMPRQASGIWGVGLIPNKGSGTPWIGVGMDALGRTDIYRYNVAPLLRRTDTTASPAGNESSKLRVEVVGEQVRLYVNDRHVSDTSTPNLQKTNALTLFVATNKPPLEAWFRRVRVWEHSASPTAASPSKPPSSVVPAPGMPHTWTDSHGRKITAEFVRANATTLTIRLLNGKEMPVPLASLSAESRQLAAALSKTPSAGAFTNSLGMRFVPVPGTQVLFCVHETRQRDYAAYAANNRSINTAWQNQSYAGHPITSRGTDHPVTKLTVTQAMLFCEWLSQKEGRKYRLPTNEEWTQASQGADIEFPWGRAWPPPPNAGNYSDESYHQLRPTDPYLKGYDDLFPTTAPVMSFPPNALGVHDLGGNVWEWVHAGDPASATLQNNPPMLQRGASFLHDSRDFLRSRKEAPATSTVPDTGFRVVLEPSPVSAGLTTAPTLEPAPVTAPAQVTPSKATKDTPYINSLDMKFVPVPGTKVLMCIYEARVRDFRVFVKTAQFDYKKGPPTFYGGREQPELDWEYQVPNKPPVGDDHPVQHVSWEDAQAFNQWLTRHELDAGHLPPGHSYRLPTSAEWSSATGPGPYGWGSEWPPPPMAGNFTNNVSQTAGDLPLFAWDTFGGSSPVGSFPPNRLGLFDLDGNSCELGEEVIMQNGVRMVDARGTNFAASRNPRSLNINSHRSMSSNHRHICQGFRCVLELPSSTP